MDRKRKLKPKELQGFPYEMIEKVTESLEEYDKFLAFYSKFFRYNIINALMIYGQNPDATAVGTYEQWKSERIGRGVRKKAFPIRIMKGQAWETAFDIADTYGQAFAYKNSYTLTEQEMERLTVPLGVSGEIGDAAAKIEYFLAKSIIEEMGQNSRKNENFDNTIKGNWDVLFGGAYHMTKLRYHIESTLSIEQEEWRSFQRLPAAEKVKKLQYIQPMIKNAILEMDKGIARIRSEQVQPEAPKTPPEPELRFNSYEFEKLLPQTMRYKQVNKVNGNEIYWVTQDIFSVEELQQFRQAVREYDGDIKKFYVTARDLSPHYSFEDDRAENILAVVTPDTISEEAYVNAIRKAGLGEYLKREPAEKKEEEPITEVETNIGTMPIEDYRDIVASRAGFDTEMQAYQQQVREEIAQEAASAGLTVAEYAANGYDADPSVSIEAMHAYGYTDPDMLPLSKERAMELFRQDIPVYLLYEDNSEGLAFEAEDIAEFSGYFGISREDWDSVKDEIQAEKEERTDENGITDRVYTGGKGEAGGDASQRQDGGDLNRGGRNVNCRDLRRFGNRPRQMGSDVGGMDDGEPFGTGSGTDAGGNLRHNGNQGERGNRGISGASGEELERTPSPSDQRELSGTGALRAGGEDVSRELSDARGEQQNLPREISDEESIAEETEGRRKLTPSVKWQGNLAAITTLKELERTGRQATQADRETLSRFSGFGSLPQVFDEKNEQWVERRNRLKALLTKEEYDSLEESTLSAHYTSPEIIRAMYTALEQFGVNGGNILEPAMGNGAFFANMPPALKEHSKLYGVELNTITGKIAQQLYPEAKIEVNGFEDTKFQDDSFDAVVGNVPFGSFKVYDPKYNHMKLLIHDYFFIKALDKLKTDGVLAFITSKGTMDKASSKVRQYLAERAELLGAIRLPNNAFAATSGEVKVTTDILFLKKRERPVIAEKEPWIYTNQTANGLPINEYFINHPEMVLGKMTVVNGQYGRKDIACVDDGRNFVEALNQAVARIGEDYRSSHAPMILPEPAVIATEDAKGRANCITADPEVKNYCYTVIDDRVYYRENDIMVSDEKIQGKKEERIKALVELRRDTTQMLKMQLREDIADEEIKELQKSLSEKYDEFLKKFGTINNQANTAAFRQDTDFPLVSSLEVMEENGETKKADIFTKRTLTPYQVPEHCETSQEAYAVCLNEKRAVDLAFITRLTGKSEEETIGDLRGMIYLNPKTEQWEAADAYLSGRVIDKLEEAKAAAAADPRFEENVTALLAVQPEYIESYDIAVQIGAPWIHAKYYEQFIQEKFAPDPWEKLDAQYNSILNSWYVAKPYSRHTKLEATSVYGTSRMDAYSMLENLLNQRSIQVYDYYKDAEGRDRRKLNKEDTIAAREKADEVREEFASWLFDEPSRRKELTDLYNRMFNSERVRTYDGSFLRYHGMNEAIQLKPHQNDAVARILFGGNTLLAHTMGAGKTFAMTAAAMEMKRMGLAKKPMIIVPNHLVEQWAKEFKQLYPLANVLAASKKDFEKSNRQRFCGRIATGDWDAIIMGHSSFEKIPISREREEKNIQKQIHVIREALQENTPRFAWQHAKEPIGVKQLRTTLKNLEQNLKELRNTPRDNVITFEELGVDALFVDEAHSFKNKYLYSKMQSIAGIQKSGSKKSTDLEMKCDYINERAGGERNVVFATGTPISNSIAELYTMQSYLQKSVLKEKGLEFFDNWAANFGQVKSMLEIAPDGKGFRMRDKFARFVAVPELMNDFRKVADIQTPEMLDLPVPQVKGGKPQTIATEASPEQKALVNFLSQVSEKISTGAVPAEAYNMLCVTTDGRLGALDMRAVNLDKLKALGESFGLDTSGLRAERNPNGKLAACAAKVAEIYHRTTDTKGTQMIFSDIATPTTAGRFNAYDALRTELIHKGVKPEEIAFVHDAKNDKQKQELFEKVQNGVIRVLLGSTQKMGAGTNVQQRLVALHHADCPWRPSDLQQREGRIVRQGNTNKEVEIYNYVTKGTFDSYLWQIIENKQRFISQILNNATTARIFEDTDTIVLNAAEVKAVAMDDPMIRRKMELEIEVQRVRVLEKQYNRNKFMLQDKLAKEYPSTIKRLHKRIDCLEKDIAVRNEKRFINGKELAFAMTIMGKTYTDRAEAGEELQKQVMVPKNQNQVIGEYMGMKLTPLMEGFGEYKLMVNGTTHHKAEVSESPIGTVRRIENIVSGLDAKLTAAREELDTAYKQTELAKEKLEKPFERSEELKSMTKELNRINAQLDIGKENIGTVVEEVEETVTMEIEPER